MALPKAGLTCSDETLVCILTSCIYLTFVLLIPAFGNARPLPAIK